MADNKQRKRVTRSIIHLRIQTPVITLCIILLTMLLMVQFGIKGAAFIFIAMLGGVLIGHPKWLLPIYFTWAIYLAPSLKVLITSSPIFFLDEILTMMMFGLTIAYHVITQPRHPHSKPVFFTAAFLICFALLSGYMNQVPRECIIQYFTTYFRFFVFFFFVITFLKSFKIKTFLISLVLVMYSQIFLNLLWLTGINPIANARSATDFFIGSLSSSKYLAYYMIAFICICFAAFKQKQFRKYKLFIAGNMAVATIQLAATFAFHAYFILAGCLIFQTLTTKHIQKVNKWISVVSGIILVAALVLVAQTDTPLGDLVEYNLSPRILKYRLEALTAGAKSKAYKDVIVHAPKYYPYPFLGAGPGNFGSIVACNRQRPLAGMYITYLWGSVDEMKLSEGHSITGRPDTGAITLWSELGAIGYFVFWGLHLYALLRIGRQHRQKLYTDPIKSILAEAFPPVMLMWLTLSFLMDFLYLDYMQCGIWTWAAFIWIPDTQPESNILADETTPSQQTSPMMATESNK